MMLAEAFRWLRSKGVRRATLWAVDPNPDARRAWEKMGYLAPAHYMGRRF